MGPIKVLPSTPPSFKSQAGLTDGLLGRIPARDALAEEWMKLDRLQPARYREMASEGGRVFYKKTLGGENVGKIYYRQGWTGEEQLLFDPKTVTPTGAKAGTVTTVRSIHPSPDGRRVLLALQASGAEWSELRVIDVQSKKLLPDRVYPSWDATAGPRTARRSSMTRATSRTSRARRSSSITMGGCTGSARPSPTMPI